MLKMKWSNFWKGFVMGTTDLIPGVSGGTIALLLGIYDNFILSISRIFSKHFVESLRFLIPIALGMFTAIGSLSIFIEYLLREHKIPTMFFFMGLIFGIIPYLLRIAKFKNTFTRKHYSILIFSIIIMLCIGLIDIGGRETENSLSLSTPLIIKYFLAGALAASAMLLPGISGSFILLVLGVYSTVIFAISEFISLNFNAIPILSVVGLGIIFGFVISSKIIYYCLNNYTYETYALVLGLVVGSLYSVFPGLPDSPINLILSTIALIIGFIISYKLGKITGVSTKT